MKKIIELAERIRAAQRKFYSNDDGIPRKLAYADLTTKEKLFDDVLAEYKRLSETPITENWLTEHGWEDCDTDEAGNHHWYYLEHGTYGIEVPIFCTEDGRWYVRGWDLRITNLAQLLDAMELCGITMED